MGALGDKWNIKYGVGALVWVRHRESLTELIELKPEDQEQGDVLCA